MSKLSVWGPNRQAALRRMARALSEYVIIGVRTNLVFHQKLLAHPDFVAGRYDTGFIEGHAADLFGYSNLGPEERESLAAALAIAASRVERGASPAAARSELSTRPSTWVAQHRARTLR